MDILQLQYFVAIVQNNNNLSRAAERLHISQPALSQYLNKFEKDEQILLFHRQSGRLAHLTPAGERMYMAALSILETHDKMLQDIREISSHFRGTIRIGIPPLILTVLFTRVMAQLMILNPNISFVVIEKGSFELRKMLLLGELDLAIMITPHDLNSIMFDEVEITLDELSAFMNTNHHLNSKDLLEWQDLKNENLAIFNDTFMIHHHLMKKFNSLRLRPKFALMSGSWDFLIEITRTTDFITILPSPIKDHFMMNEITEVKFKDPIPWRVVILHERKEAYSLIHSYIIDSLVNYFVKGEDVKPYVVQSFSKE